MIKNKLESEDYFDSYDIQLGETQSVSLCEHVADIYQDLKDFVLLFSKNTITARLSAAYLCKMRYAGGWGKKILTIMPYLHVMMYKDESNEDMYL